MPSIDIQMQPVDSAAFAAIGYDHASHTLAVEFHGGRTYVYRDITPEEYERFFGAESLGRHFAQHLRGREFDQEEDEDAA